MKLHNNMKLFSDTIRYASQQIEIKELFVEKDYWITLVLSQLANSLHSIDTVFKGGTSLSKGFGLIDRFSEDIDIAIINNCVKSGNAIKNLLRSVEKEMTKDLLEISLAGITSKGSRFRKSVFEYPSIYSENDNKLIVEINSFANPFPFVNVQIKSFLFDFLIESGKENIIEQYCLQPFQLKVLSKDQTLLEKLVSLIRFSYDNNPIDSLSKKIRHFYDIYFLMLDTECSELISTNDFNVRLNELLKHDKDIFDEPNGWQDKMVSESIIINNFDNIWSKLKPIYKSELSTLSYTTIPDEDKVAGKFKEIVGRIISAN